MYAKRNVLARIGLRLQPISIACLHSLAPSLQHIEHGYEIQGWPTEGHKVCSLHWVQKYYVPRSATFVSGLAGETKYDFLQTHWSQYFIRKTIKNSVPAVQKHGAPPLQRQACLWYYWNKLFLVYSKKFVTYFNIMCLYNAENWNPKTLVACSSRHAVTL